MPVLLSLSGHFIPGKADGIKALVAGFICCGLIAGKSSAESHFEEASAPG